MRPHNAFFVSLFFLTTLLLVLTAFNFSQPQANALLDAVPALQQSTPTPLPQNTSEIGSTDGILIMGVVIVLIVTLPLFLHKRK